MRIRTLCLARLMALAWMGWAAQGWGDDREFFHLAGFAMTLPAGWSAVPADEGQFQLVPPNAGESEGVLVLAMPAGEIRDARDRPAGRRDRGHLRQYPPGGVRLRRLGGGPLR